MQPISNSLYGQALFGISQVAMHERATFDDLYQLPGGHNRFEIEDGNLIVSPPASDRHDTAVGRLAGLLSAADSDDPAEHLIAQIGARLDVGSDHVRADLAVVNSAAQNSLVRIDPKNVKLVVEVVESRTTKRDLVSKIHLYAELGIEWYWTVLIDGDDYGIYQYQLMWDRYSLLPYSVKESGRRGRVEIWRPYRTAFDFDQLTMP